MAGGRSRQDHDVDVVTRQQRAEVRLERYAVIGRQRRRALPAGHGTERRAGGVVGGDLRPRPAHEPGADDPDPDGHATVRRLAVEEVDPGRPAVVDELVEALVGVVEARDPGGAAIEPELVPGRQLLGPRADVGHPLRVLVGQLMRLGEALPAGHLEVLVAHDLVGAPVELDGLRVAPDLRAALAEDLEQRRDLVGEDVEVELVAVARGQTHRVVLAVTADQQLDPRGARRPRTVGQVVDPGVGPLEA